MAPKKPRKKKSRPRLKKRKRRRNPIKKEPKQEYVPKTEPRFNHALHSPPPHPPMGLSPPPHGADRMSTSSRSGSAAPSQRQMGPGPALNDRKRAQIKQAANGRSNPDFKIVYRPPRACMRQGDPLAFGKPRATGGVIHINGVDVARFYCKSIFPNDPATFNTNTGLARYVRKQRWQVNGKDFVCPTCGKECVCMSMLINHCRTHTGSKPYKCPIKDCEYRTAVKANLKHHLQSAQIHGGKKTLKKWRAMLDMDTEKPLIQTKIGALRSRRHRFVSQATQCSPGDLALSMAQVGCFHVAPPMGYGLPGMMSPRPGEDYKNILPIPQQMGMDLPAILGGHTPSPGATPSPPGELSHAFLKRECSPITAAFYGLPYCGPPPELENEHGEISPRASSQKRRQPAADCAQPASKRRRVCPPPLLDTTAAGFPCDPMAIQHSPLGQHFGHQNMMFPTQVPPTINPMVGPPSVSQWTRRNLYRRRSQSAPAGQIFDAMQQVMQQRHMPRAQVPFMSQTLPSQTNGFAPPALNHNYNPAQAHANLMQHARIMMPGYKLP